MWAVALVVERADGGAATAVLALVGAARQVLALAVLAGVALVADAPGTKVINQEMFAFQQIK